MHTGARQARSEDDSQSQALAQLYKTVLELISSEASLPEVLKCLCGFMEQQFPGTLCSVLLLDADGITLRHGAAPSLPSAYCQAIDGCRIGPNVGSCGTAAHTGKPVVVSDIANDILWKDYRQLALPHGLKACWSTPIFSRSGKVLGTFAVYYREVREPDPQHWQMIERATHLAGVAIERERSDAKLRAAETRYRNLVERLPAITYIAEVGVLGPGTTSARRFNRSWVFPRLSGSRTLRTGSTIFIRKTANMPWRSTLSSWPTGAGCGPNIAC